MIAGIIGLFFLMIVIGLPILFFQGLSGDIDSLKKDHEARIAARAAQEKAVSETTQEKEQE